MQEFPFKSSNNPNRFKSLTSSALKSRWSPSILKQTQNPRRLSLNNIKSVNSAYSSNVSKSLSQYSRLPQVRNAFGARVSNQNKNSGFFSKILTESSNYLKDKTKLLYTDPILFLAEINPFVPSDILESGIKSLGIKLATHPQYHPLMISTAVRTGKLMNSNSSNISINNQINSEKSVNSSFRPFHSKWLNYIQVQSKKNPGILLNANKTHIINTKLSKLKSQTNSSIYKNPQILNFIKKTNKISG